MSERSKTATAFTILLTWAGSAFCTLALNTYFYQRHTPTQEPREVTLTSEPPERLKIDKSTNYDPCHADTKPLNTVYEEPAPAKKPLSVPLTTFTAMQQPRTPQSQPVLTSADETPPF